jgi:uncharacterized protein YceK
MPVFTGYQITIPHQNTLLAIGIEEAGKNNDITSTETEETSGDWKYTDNGTTITIDSYTGNAAMVTIPSMIKGKPVTSISAIVFYRCDSLTSITIPNSITFIDDGVFMFCRNLTNINVENANIYYSSENGILYDKSKSTILCYPGGKSGAFAIPNSVTSIGNWAFSGCSNLTSLTIPSSVASIGNSAFSGCSSLTSINAEKANSYYSSENGILYDKSMSTLLCYPGGKVGTFEIPNSVKSIGESGVDINYW